MGGLASEAAQRGNAIIGKWRENTADRDGYFRRHRDGNLENHDPSNVVLVSPAEAFRALHHGEDVADDWIVGLSDEEISFVRSHAQNFHITYERQQEEAGPSAPPAGMYDARLEDDMQAAMAHPEVVRLLAEGDAALEAGESERAVELYTTAKHIRDQLLPLDLSGGSSSHPRQARHGRRSPGGPVAPSPAPSQRASILSSQPSRRRQPAGAPTPKEEVAARIAARNAQVGR